MARYMCLCGVQYHNKEMADLHVNMNVGHQVFEKSRMGRFWDWFWQYNWSRFFRFAGAFMVYMVVINHFKINWSMWEATLIGVGMGLYIE